MRRLLGAPDVPSSENESKQSLLNRALLRRWRVVLFGLRPLLADSGDGTVLGIAGLFEPFRESPTQLLGSDPALPQLEAGPYDNPLEVISVDPLEHVSRLRRAALLHIVNGSSKDGSP